MTEVIYTTGAVVVAHTKNSLAILKRGAPSLNLEPVLHKTNYSTFTLKQYLVFPPLIRRYVQ
jgi:hypothetical protein